jgi:hypothetical protein
MTDSGKIILDLCGGTGAWSKPYKDAGYDVRLITLPEYDVQRYIPPENVYGILAAPPCTEFSIAKGNRPRDFRGALEIVKACLEIIWRVWTPNKTKFWCLENPRGFLRQWLGIPKTTIWYWQYGDLLGKPTDLWGYFNCPSQRYTEPPGLLNRRDKIKELRGEKNMSRSEIRAKTPPGFAQAFFEANQ